jgi:hypothetical protein
MPLGVDLVAVAKSTPSGSGDAPSMDSTPLTAIARTRRAGADLTVELVDLADDEVLGRIRAALPAGRGAVLQAIETAGKRRVADRLVAALADELRAIGRRRLTRVLDAGAPDERTLLASLGFVELRSDRDGVTLVLDL